MSVVSGVVLIVSSCEENGETDTCTAWERANAWLVERGYAALARVERHASGTKHPQIWIGCAGLNHFRHREDEFAAFVLGLDWVSMENVVLTIQPEEGDTRVWRSMVVPRVMT